MKRPSIFKTAMILFLAAFLTLVPGGATYSQEVVPTPQNYESVPLSKDEVGYFQIFGKVRDLIKEYHTKEVPLDVLYKGAISGMVEALGDRYSQYFTPDQMDAWLSDLEGEYGGIGVTIELVGGTVMITSVFSGSPAETAGLKAGDVIVSVEGTDMAGRLPNDAAVLLRGEPGTEVEAVFFRPSSGEVLNREMLRDKIVQPPMEVRSLGEDLHYVRVLQFNEEAAHNFPVVIDVLRNSGMKGLVLDLRDNPGGLVNACVEMACKLVPKGPVFELGRKDLMDVVENETDVEPVPVVVLINGGTASASEILAGAVRDRGVGVLVGETTFGKGCIQSLVELDDGMGGVKLTIAEYRTAGGHPIEGKGLEPDYPVDIPEIAIPAPPQYKRVLKHGMIGLDVLAVQENLSFLGYSVGEPDGIFGQNTAAAVQAFLKEQGLQYDGAIDEIQMRLVGVACVQAVKDRGDLVQEKGLELLKKKVSSGLWE